jgi:hypothetical protein
VTYEYYGEGQHCSGCGVFCGSSLCNRCSAGINDHHISRANFSRSGPHAASPIGTTTVSRSANTSTRGSCTQNGIMIGASGSRPTRALGVTRS